MKLKNIFAACSAAAVALTASSCASSKIIQLDETANGSIVECRTGDNIEIRLPGNATTGYMWTLANVPADTVLVKTKDQYLILETDRKMVGAPGVAVFNFEVTGAGNEGIRLVYQRSWEKNNPAGKFEVLVKAKGKASLF